MAKVSLVDPVPFAIGPRESPGTVRAWGNPVVVSGPAPTSQFDRMATHAQSSLAGSYSAVGQIASSWSYRLLTPFQIDLIYQRCPDVRSCIDGIVRRVATHDWEVCPTIELDDPRYDAALEASVAVQRWLSRPTQDGTTWQEVMTMFCCDLLKHDAGVMERVRDRKGRLVEAVPIRGPDVHPIQDAYGRLDFYVQVPYTPSMVDFTASATSIRLEVDQVLYMMLFPSTNSPEGMPLLESLVNEVITILRAADYQAHAVDLNEVPPGLLVLVGVAKDAAERMKAEYEQKAAADWKMRILASPTKGEVDARWVEFRKAAKELQLVELAMDIRRTIWRVFGVSPVEQGATEGMPRATAEVQLDVSGSHLIQPILELVAAKVNALLVADLVDPDFVDLVEFRWVDHKELTPAERLEQATAITTLVDRGLITRDEGRETLGYDPYADGIGSVPTIVDGKAGVVRLADVVNAPTPEEQAAADAAAKQPESAGSANADESSAESDGPGDAPGNDAVAEARVPQPIHVHRTVGLRTARSATDGVPPEGWSREDVRAALTVDLDVVWDEMVGYRIEVEALWEAARAGVLDAVAAEPVLDAVARARIQGVLSSEVHRLATDWALLSRPRYRRAAESSRVRVGNAFGVSGTADEVRTEADVYHLRAVGYLTADDGLLTDLARDVMDRLTSDHDGARARTGSSISSALTAVGAAFGAAKHRIGNWVGKLVALATQVLGTQAVQAAAAGNDPLLCEWADVGGAEECDTCNDYGSRGWMDLATLPTVPGDNGTECRANCRCVLRIFRKSEVDAGTAVLVGAGNTP